MLYKRIKPKSKEVFKSARKEGEKNKKKREQEKNRHTFSQRRHLKAELRPGALARFRFFAAAATTGLKGREKMIVVNPQTVTNRELAALAMQAKGRISRLYLHWTAGHYEDVYDDYHLNIGPGGEMYLTCKTFTEVKEHTWHRNTGSIGIALCCASEAQACSGRDTDFGGEPPTVVQIETLAKTVAVLTACLELEINVLTVTTHCEAALFDGYGPHSGDPQLRWDLWYLPDLPLDSALKPGGYVIRGKALWYLSEILRQRR